MKKFVLVLAMIWGGLLAFAAESSLSFGVGVPIGKKVTKVELDEWNYTDNSLSIESSEKEFMYGWIGELSLRKSFLGSDLLYAMDVDFGKVRYEEMSKVSYGVIDLGLAYCININKEKNLKLIPAVMVDSTLMWGDNLSDEDFYLDSSFGIATDVRFEKVFTRFGLYGSIKAKWLWDWYSGYKGFVCIPSAGILWTF